MKEILNEPITKAVMIMLGYNFDGWRYHKQGGAYIIKHVITMHIGNHRTEAWRVFHDYHIDVWFKDLHTIGELRDFHKGMTGEDLLETFKIWASL